ncbi:MAG: response regulator [Bacteroidia bacterium]
MNTQQIIDILLVEDREEDAELTMMALKNYRLANNIKWVKDGQEALDYLFATADKMVAPINRPKIILLDLKMPKVDGIEVLRAIRNDPRTKTIPVIILTTSREEKDVVDAYNLHANSYIVKPVGFDKFTESVKEIGLYWLLLNEPPVH